MQQPFNVRYVRDRNALSTKFCVLQIADDLCQSTRDLGFTLRDDAVTIDGFEILLEKIDKRNSDR